MEIMILIMTFGAAFVLTQHAYRGAPVVAKSFTHWHERKVDQQRVSLKKTMLIVNPKKLVIINTFSPLICGVGFGLLGLKMGSVLIGGMVGLAIGFGIPSIVITTLLKARAGKFNAQITSALMILSSCLKGGLSLLQSIEAVVEELPPPVSHEFGLILRENKMGVSLEESFDKLNKRLPSEELNLLTSAILVARETGGDITQLFSALIDTIRAKMKVQDSVKTLSLQGKIQGIVMSVLPIGFTVMVMSFNPGYFDTMLGHPIGRAMLVYGVVSELVGIVLIKMFSKVKL